jgi:hypothetical protein
MKLRRSGAFASKLDSHFFVEDAEEDDVAADNGQARSFADLRALLIG